jgi:hypothetical protein
MIAYSLLINFWVLDCATNMPVIAQAGVTTRNPRVSGGIAEDLRHFAHTDDVATRTSPMARGA